MSDASLEKWQLLLNQKKTELKSCQDTYQLESCMQCDKLLNCKLRDDYVKAVYDSMSKGKSGGFEF